MTQMPCSTAHSPIASTMAGGHTAPDGLSGLTNISALVRGVRAALCNDLYTARMARAHNDANVLSIGARVVGVGLAEEILATFLTTPFEGGRHLRRVQQLMALEQEF